MNIEDIIQYTQKTPENTNPNILRNMLNSLVKEDTGNFTTCKVTVVNYSDKGYDISMPLFSSLYSYTDMYTLGTGSTDVVDVILYKGMAIGAFSLYTKPLANKCNTTGNVSYDYSSNMITITGDGTITIDS